MRFTPTQAEQLAEQAMAPFCIVITPSPDDKAYVVNYECEPELEKRVAKIARFIGDQLVNNPKRPSRKRAKK